MLLMFMWMFIVGPAQSPAAPPPPASSLDFEVFKTQVQPIFLAKRVGHARCVTCHSTGTPLRLQPLASGAAMWNDEQARKNFEAVQREVLPGVPLKSRLLIHPLATDAGG